MFRILSPDTYKTSPWKNGGGVTHEILRDDGHDAWQWRISIAEVAADGPFSRFEGMSRILTVIEGAGVDLHTPEGILVARLYQPVDFSGDTPVESRMVNGPIRDLNVIFDSRHITASVDIVEGACRIAAGQGRTGVLCLAGTVHADGARLPPMGFALGDRGEIALAMGARCALVRLTDPV